MRLPRIRTMHVLIILIIGSLFMGELMLNTEYKWSAKADDDWIPENLEGLYIQRQGMNFDAVVNHAYYIDGDIIYKDLHITLYPQDTEIRITLEVRFVKIGDVLHPVYSISYTGEFKYENPANTTVYFPLPLGTITDLIVKINGIEVDKLDIVSNQVGINLTQGNSTMSISFNSFGKSSYSHDVPKNIFVENFTLELKIINVNDHDIDPERGESPNTQTSKGKSVTLNWDNENTIMRKNVVVDIQSRTVVKEKDPWPFFTQFFYGLLYLGPIICVFYVEGMHRVERDKKGENVIFILLPYLLLCVLMGFLIYWIGILASLFISVLGFSLTSYLMEKRAIRITKGLSGIFVIPVLLIMAMIGLILGEFRIGMMLTLISSLSLIGAVTIFYAKNPRQQSYGFSRRSKKPPRSDNGGNGVAPTAVKAPPPKGKVDQVQKKFCPHCGFSVKSDYGFCPKCGKDNSLLERCSRCGVLRKTSDDALFCPNCGNLERHDSASLEPKKRYFARSNNENQI